MSWWMRDVEALLFEVASLRSRLADEAATGPTTSGGAIRVSRGRRARAPGATSQPEQFVLHNDERIAQVKAFVDTVRSVALTWAESLVLLRFYWRGEDLHAIALDARLPVGALARARRRLLHKLAVALGYLPGTVERRPTLEEAREDLVDRAAQLRVSGMTYRAIAEALGVSEETARRYAQEASGAEAA